MLVSSFPGIISLSPDAYCVQSQDSPEAGGEDPGMLEEDTGKWPVASQTPWGTHGDQGHTQAK